MAGKHVPISLKETKEVMKKFQKPPVIKLSKSECRKGNMQKVLQKYSEIIRLNPITVFQFPQSKEIQFKNPAITYLNVVHKKRKIVKKRIFSSLLFDKNTSMTVQDYMEISKQCCTYEALIESLLKPDTQIYSENNDDIEKFLREAFKKNNR